MRWLLVLLVLAGCAVPQYTPPRHDPLAGRIFTAAGKEFQIQELYASLAQYDVIHLGEAHDNREHHRQQYALIRELVRQGKKPALGLEFFSQAQTPILMNFAQSQPFRDAADQAKRLKALRNALGWADASDEAWDAYSPFLVLAKEQGLAIFGADLAQSLSLRIAQVGVQGLTALEQSQVPKTNFQDPVYQAWMIARFVEGHCGWSDEKLMARLYETWLVRNQAMANAVIAMKPQGQPVVLIVGNGHLEGDMAVVERIRSQAPHLKQLNLGFTEINFYPTLLEQYLAPVVHQGKVFGPPHQVVWITERASWTNPCEQYKEALKHHAKQGNERN